MTTVSVIVPLCNAIPQTFTHRLEAINHVLNNCFINQTDIALEVIYVEQTLDGRPHFLPNIELKKTPVREFLGNQYILIRAPRRNPYEVTDIFVKGWCINVGVMKSDAQYVLIADSDIFCPNSSISKSVECLSTHSPWCFAWERLWYTDEAERTSVMKDDYLFVEKAKKYPTIATDKLRTPQPEYNEGGWVLFNRGFFLSIGGASEHILMLGGPDNELIRRAQHASGNYPIHGTLVYHLWHPVMASRWNLKHINLAVYAQTKKHPQDVIFWQSGQDIGNPESPLWIRKEFLK